VGRPFDAVLVVSFGGPEGLSDIRPFLENVVRGRRIPPERLDEVAHHYELFGGVSPLTAITRRQVAGLQSRLAASGLDIPIYLGMRNWQPLLADTLREMAHTGVRRAVGFICAAHRSYSSCTQYRQNVTDARAHIRREGLPDVAVTYVRDWHHHPGFIEANAQHIEAARERLPATLRDRARVIFTAHSIPVSMFAAQRYVAQLRESAALVAGRLALPDSALVFQSRSGRPDDPWLEPDVCDYLRAERASGLEAAILCPLGFLCDHIEVLYDLDREAADVCREIGVTMVRAESVNDDPLFLDTMADLVMETWHRYETGVPLPLVAATPPERPEGPPVHRGRPSGPP
jgi:protoporphyrin/coproporphyrin ferrochelatase